MSPTRGVALRPGGGQNRVLKERRINLARDVYPGHVASLQDATMRDSTYPGVALGCYAMAPLGQQTDPRFLSGHYPDAPFRHTTQLDDSFRHLLDLVPKGFGQLAQKLVNRVKLGPWMFQVASLAWLTKPKSLPSMGVRIATHSFLAFEGMPTPGGRGSDGSMGWAPQKEGSARILVSGTPGKPWMVLRAPTTFPSR